MADAAAALPDPLCPACGAAFAEAQKARIEARFQQDEAALLRTQLAAQTARAEAAERLAASRTARVRQLEARLAPRPAARVEVVVATPVEVAPAGPLLEID